MIASWIYVNHKTSRALLNLLHHEIFSCERGGNSIIDQLTQFYN